MKNKKKKKVDYVSKIEFLEEMKVYKNEYDVAIVNNNSPPKISDSIAQKIIDICTRLSYSPNFMNYPFRDDMVGDAIENCLQYIHNFDPTFVSEKNKDNIPNPFAYFTQIAYWAMVRRIVKEKNQLNIKAKYVQNLGIDPNLQNISDLQEHDSDKEFSNNYITFLKDLYDVDLEAENKKKKVKKKKK